MYQLSLLPRKVLICTDEVINQGPTDSSVDPRMLLSAIQIAEDRFIKPAIGKEMYYDLRDKKNQIVTEVNKEFLSDQINEGREGDEVIELKVGDIINAIEFVENDWYVQLWNEYLWKLIAECVVYTASPTNWSRFTASGEMQNNPKSVALGGDGKAAASSELKEVQWKLDKLLMDRIDPLFSAMKEWICDNKEHFPLYKKCPICKTEDGVSFNRKSPWIHGIYKN